MYFISQYKYFNLILNESLTHILIALRYAQISSRKSSTAATETTKTACYRTNECNQLWDLGDQRLKGIEIENKLIWIRVLNE